MPTIKFVEEPKIEPSESDTEDPDDEENAEWETWKAERDKSDRERLVQARSLLTEFLATRPREAIWPSFSGRSPTEVTACLEVDENIESGRPHQHAFHLPS